MSPNTIPQHCRHVAINAADAPLNIATGAVPTPHADEILIQVAAAGINRADLLQRAGLYPPPEDASPVLGLEVAGTVVATGDSVEDWHAGDAVCALTHGGGYAEYAVAPVGQCLPVPTGFSMTEAAALPEALLTIWHNLYQRARLLPGEPHGWRRGALRLHGAC